jgi:hypothetical protein
MTAFYKVSVEKNNNQLASMLFRTKEANIAEVLRHKALLSVSSVLPKSIELLWENNSPSGLIDTLQYSFAQIKEFGQAGFLSLDNVHGVSELGVERAYEIKSLIKTLKEKLERIDMLADAAFSCYEDKEIEEAKLVNEINIQP